MVKNDRVLADGRPGIVERCVVTVQPGGEDQDDALENADALIEEIAGLRCRLEEAISVLEAVQIEDDCNDNESLSDELYRLVDNTIRIAKRHTQSE
ncbi:MAG: hypothetical protein GF334_04415 [Candidatus Altiarchaeales archaeon]|nr:hypothetical protein [Candidatus Altiarchaeales archaeon]